MENKILGDVNLVKSSDQFREEGKEQVVDTPLAARFHSVFASIDLPYAQFSDFTKSYPFLLDTELGDISAGDLVETTLFDDLRLKSFDPATEEHLNRSTVPYYNATITKYLPWVFAEDVATGDQTWAFAVRLYMKTPNHTFSLQVPSGYGFDTVFDTADDAPPSPGSDDNTLWKMVIRPTAGDVVVKAFGLMYDMNLITP